MPLKDTGQGHPPGYRGSLQPPAEARGRTQPHLGGRPPQPGTPNKRHGAAQRGRLREPVYRAASELAPAQSRSKGGAAPRRTALLQPAAPQGPGSAGSCRLPKAASPALLTGTRDRSWGQRSCLTPAPTTGPARWQLTSAPGSRPRPWLQAGHAAHATAKRLRSLLTKQGRGRTLSPPEPFGALPVAARSRPFPPGKAKLRWPYF